MILNKSGNPYYCESQISKTTLQIAPKDAKFKNSWFCGSETNYNRIHTKKPLHFLQTFDVGLYKQL